MHMEVSLFVLVLDMASEQLVWIQALRLVQLESVNRVEKQVHYPSYPASVIESDYLLEMNKVNKPNKKQDLKRGVSDDLRQMFLALPLTD